MPEGALVVVLGSIAAALGGGWVYFRRWQLERPPIGVITPGDMAVTLLGVVAMPLLYLRLPPAWCAALLLLPTVSLIALLVRPMVQRTVLAWLLSCALSMVEVGAVVWLGRGTWVVLLINNVLMVALAVGIANLWAQSGLRARELAFFSAGLLVYDIGATTLLGTMDALFGHLWSVPFAPLIAWPTRGGHWLGVGLGDVIIATLGPLVLRKAWGRRAGVTALLLHGGALGGLVLVLVLQARPVTVPAMALLGPLVLVQYGYWRRHGRERTTAAYLRAEPIKGARPGSPPAWSLQEA